MDKSNILLQGRIQCPTPLHLTLDALGHRGLLVVCVFVLHLLSNSPEWSPLLGTTGAPAPGSSRDPVSLRSRSRNDSNTVPVLVSLMHLLQVRYRFFIHGARVASITGRSRPPGGVGLTPRQYTVWNVEGRARSTGGLSLSRGCCLQCTVLPALGGVLPNLELSHKEPKQQTPQPCAWVVYIYSW